MKKRMLSALLAAILLMQCFLCTVSASSDKVFTFEKEGALLAVNTDRFGESPLSIDVDGTFTGQNEPDCAAVAGGFACGTSKHMAEPVEAMSPREAAVYSKNHPQEVIESQEYKLRARKTIYDERNFEMECVYVGKYTTIWLDVDLLSEYEKYAEQYGAVAEQAVREMLDVFGDVRVDTDRDGRTAFFLYDIPLEGVGGFFNSLDLIDRTNRIEKVWIKNRYKSLNHCDGLHIDVGDFASGLANFRSIVIHEFQHYIAESYRYHNKNQYTYIKADIHGFITEGFSGCATYVLDDWKDNAEAFSQRLESAGHICLPVSPEYDYYVPVGFVFSQYIRTRYAQMEHSEEDLFKPGSSIYKRYLSTLTQENSNDPFGHLATILYPEIPDVDTAAKQLILDFWMAVYLKEPTGPHGFLNEEWADDICVNYFFWSGYGQDQEIGACMARFYVVYTDGTILVQNENPDIQLIQLEKSGHTLYVARPGQKPEAFDQGFTVQTKSINNIFWGSRFVGWSFSPEAKTADVPARITLTEDTTIYPVLEEITEHISVGKNYTLCQGEYAFYFEPEETQYIAIPSGTAVVASDPEDYMSYDILFYWDNFDVRKFEGGHTYEIHYTPNEEQSSFCISVAPKFYELVYDFGYDTETLYVLDGENTEVFNLSVEDSIVAEDSGMYFSGWETADKQFYTPGQSVEITESLTLYPVWSKIETLPLDTEFTVSAENVWNHTVLRLDAFGTGRFSITVENANHTGFAQGTILENLSSDGECTQISRTLKSGTPWNFSLKTETDAYLVLEDFEPGTTVKIEKLSEMPAYVLEFRIGRKSEAFCYDVSYDLPPFHPMRLTTKPFLGWSEKANDSKAQYFSENTIDLNQDITLYPVWGKSHQSLFEQFRTLLINIVSGVGWKAEMIMMRGRDTFHNS